MHFEVDRPPCRFCHRRDVTKWCKRYNISGIKQRWYCKPCDRTFTPDDGFLWRHHRSMVIAESLSLHLRGCSESDTVNHMWQNHGVQVNSRTVHRWVGDYSTRLGWFLSLHKPRLRGGIHTDELVLKVKGGLAYSWGAIDKRTRYKISGPLTSTRSYRHGTKPLYEKLRDHCIGLPPRIVSDKLGHYRRAYNKYFYHSGVRLVHGVPIACRKHGLRYNNNPIERENQRIKARTKTMRGFKSHTSCSRLLDMLDIMHNHIKPSMALRGGYPADKAGIKLPLQRNRLLSLIQISATAC